MICNQGTANWDTRGEPSDDLGTPVDDDPTCVTVGESLVGIDAYKMATDDSGGTLLPGDIVTYTIIIYNYDTSPASVDFSDHLDTDHISYVGDSLYVDGGHITDDLTDGDGGGSSTSTVVWSGTIPGGSGGAPGMVIISFKVQVHTGLAAGTAIPNQGTIELSSPTEPTDDPSTPAPNDPTIIIVGGVVSAVEAWKTVANEAGGIPRSGDTLIYTVTLSNSNLTDLTVSFSDPLPQHTVFLSSSSVAYNAAAGRVEWSGTLPALGNVVLSFLVTVDASTPNDTNISNQGVVSWGENEEPTDDPNTPIDDDPTVIRVRWFCAPGDFALCAPNPVGDEGLVCWLDLPDDAVAAWFKVFDVDGVLLLSYELMPGYPRFPAAGRWNPQDDLGRPLANGLYLCLLQVERADGRVSRSRIYKLVVER